MTYILGSPDFGPLIAGNDAFRSAVLRNLAQELRRLTVHVSELRRRASARRCDSVAPTPRPSWLR